ncbi:YifB family Mg chelatase-like AAA ATPase [Gulosibacter bifidus]|uniref:YifB family Mg chelatase-like AAA ATPase n=1 Tax=Gulosibacter bifidus TaxID=272239 RepID=A0ABW5RI25_9MICO|nr:YifB family Mg chelatase-like AAA ATPase [Gulosibacter bifidus]
MANARSWGIALSGLRGDAVQVDVQLAAGLPKLLIIGLPDAALGESEHRLRAAMHSSGHPLPAKRLTVSLSPAELRKHGAGFDLAIAAAVLAAAGIIDPAGPARNAHLGELALTGAVRSVSGVLPAVHAAKTLGFSQILVPAAAEHEASLVDGINVVPIASLADLAEHYGAAPGKLTTPDDVSTSFVIDADAGAQPDAVGSDRAQDLADVVGNEAAVRALVVAAAGGHHLSMIGPPGSGKTMLAERLPGILPDLTADAAIEVAALRSLKSMSVGTTLSRRPPLQAPHHSASAVALIGGGSGMIQPGALSLAAHGVLFLDEAPEFSRRVLDSLRQPLESGTVTIHRARGSVTYPANAQLVIAANPCPCGNAGAAGLECRCTPHQQRGYLSRLSGPLMDRIDLQLRVERATVAQARMAAAGARGETTTAAAREQVQDARARALERLRSFGMHRNSDVPGHLLRRPELRPAADASAPLDAALQRGQISMRGYVRAARVAWTLADLDAADRPERNHITEALFYRAREC